MWENTKYFSVETRKILKKEFPNVKFSVRCDRDRIDITYNDSKLDTSEVEAKIAHFDLSEYDLYSDYWRDGKYTDPETGKEYYCCHYSVYNCNAEYIDKLNKINMQKRERSM